MSVGTQGGRVESELTKDVPDPGSYAVLSVGITKRFNSNSRSLGNMSRLQGVSQLRTYFSMVRGRGPRDLTALDTVNIAIERGEVFGLLGPNGAGKTTFIKILSTLITPDEGRAYINGVDVARRPGDALRGIQAVLSEGVGFERRLTGRQNLEFYASLYDIPKAVARERIDSLLTTVGLADKAGWSYNRYSTGMARRLLLCRVLLSDASVLVFDEPTAGLDPRAAADFRGMLTSITASSKGKTVLLSSHNLWEVQQICDRVAVLNKGRVVAVGSPHEISVSAGDSISFTITGIYSSNFDWKSMEPELARIDGVTTVSVELAEGGSEAIIDVEGSNDLDYTAVFTSLLQRKFRITSLDVPQPSLEDAFLKLTKEAEGK